MKKFLIVFFLVVVAVAEVQAQTADVVAKNINVADVKHFDELPDSAFKPKPKRSHRTNYKVPRPP